MKCPKCGYNSFDYLDSCKKCNKDLTEHKTRFNIQSILLSEMPVDVASEVAEETVAMATATADAVIDDFAGSAGDDSDDFGFDFMGDSEDDENLAFDELFEEVPSEDEVEESLPAPATAEQPLNRNLTGEEDSLELEEPVVDDFSFDETEPTTSTKEDTEATLDSPAEFGFDAEDDPAADIFAETEEDFSLDGIDFEDPDKV